jgi:hypothetical protein
LLDAAPKDAIAMAPFLRPDLVARATGQALPADLVKLERRLEDELAARGRTRPAAG